MIEGQVFMILLWFEIIGEGKFKGIFLFDCWMINLVLICCIKEMGLNFGKFEFYDVVIIVMGIFVWCIYYSCLICFDGVMLLFQQKMIENEWGMLVVEWIWDWFIVFDSVIVGVVQLVYKVYLWIYKVEKFCEFIVLGGLVFEVLLKNIDLICQFQSNEGMMLMDVKDIFEIYQYSFSGLDDIFLQFVEQISGVVGILLVCFFGQFFKGFLMGDVDFVNYYDWVSLLQECCLCLLVCWVLDIMYCLEFGKLLLDDFMFEFNLLWQMLDVDCLMVVVNIIMVIVNVLDVGLMIIKVVMIDLCENFDVIGIGVFIIDEDIENVEDEVLSGIGEFVDKLLELIGGDLILNEFMVDSVGGWGYCKWVL